MLLTSFLIERVHLTFINVLLILYRHYKDQCVVDKVSFLIERVHLTVVNVLLILYQHYKDQCVVDKFSH